MDVILAMMENGSDDESKSLQVYKQLGLKPKSRKTAQHKRGGQALGTRGQVSTRILPFRPMARALFASWTKSSVTSRP